MDANQYRLVAAQREFVPWPLIGYNTVRRNRRAAGASINTAGRFSLRNAVIQPEIMAYERLLGSPEDGASAVSK
jgi:hypothetical protein